MQAVNIQQLSRLYRNGRGIRNVNLQVNEGEVFGFLGPNGAGKTTLIRSMMGFLKPESGHLELLGLDGVRQSREARRRIGYLPSDPALYDMLTGRQNIRFSLAVRGIRDKSRVDELATRLHIDLKRRVKTLSRGNKQKVALVAALAHNPDLVILDEPTSGLDPLVQEAFAQIIQELKAQGKTVFMSSHVLSEVEALCDRVAFIRDGSIILTGTVDELKRQRVKHVSCEFRSDVPDLLPVPGVKDLQVEDRRVRFTLNGQVDALLKELAQYSLADLTISDPPLEEVFHSYYETVSM